MAMTEEAATKIQKTEELTVTETVKILKSLTAEAEHPAQVPAEIPLVVDSRRKIPMETAMAMGVTMVTNSRKAKRLHAKREEIEIVRHLTLMMIQTVTVMQTPTSHHAITQTES